ncbi:MAG TPA: PAS domain S-box protein [Desulfuromonadaceae bacterium]|jgi:PAS domain S-box-containing protein
MPDKGKEQSLVKEQQNDQRGPQDALRESEEKFAKAFHAAPTLMSISTLKEGRYLDVNEEFLNVLEFTREEVVGHTALKLGIWENPEDRQRMIRLLKENRRVRNFETNLRNKSGALIIGSISTEIIEIKGERRLLTLTRDITDFKKADQEREQLLNQLEAVLENINEGVVIADLQGKIMTMNREALAMHGYESIKQARGHLTNFMEDFYLRDLEGQTLPIEEWPLALALKGKRFNDYEIQLCHRNNGKKWVASYSGTPVHDKAGKMILAVITIRDVTGRKHMEEEIKILNARLAARAEQLEAANKELESFTYTVSHDLRKPLSVINGYCQVLKEFCGNTLDSQCRDFLDKTYDGTLHMNRLIDALLKFSQAAHILVRLETVDLSTMAEIIAAELKQTEPGRKVEFLIQPAITAYGDASLLQVVLENLLGNAWKYTARREQAFIEFGTITTEDQTIYFVRDNGTGFDMADAGMLFEAFQRLPGAEEIKGHGIGLATVARIIHRHGGRIWAEGTPDQGATFYFTLSDRKDRRLRERSGSSSKVLGA